MWSLRKAPAVWFSAAVGAMDALTGALLVLVPVNTVALFGARLPEGDDVAMRWVGAFVLGVGSTYLWALLPRDAAARGERVRVVWGATALVRLVIATFVSTMVALGRLAPAWLVVAATDALVAGAQIAWLRKEGATS